LGPNAAGCIFAFLFVGLIANRMYADKVVAIFFITFGSSLVKSFIAICMFALYLPDFTLPPDALKIVMLEALFSALLAPFILRFLRIRIPSAGFGPARAQGAPVYRWSS
jgi:hypothetical protein